VEDALEILAAAEEALLHAETVRLSAFLAFELARVAVSLKTADVTAVLLLQAAEEAALALKAAEVKALEAWEAAAIRSFDRTMLENKKSSAKSGRR
jgi:hypothetical protein